MTEPIIEQVNINPQAEEITEEVAEGGEMFDAAYVNGLRREAAKYRAERKLLAEKLAAIDAERMTKEEQAAAKLAELDEREKQFVTKSRAANLRAALTVVGAGRIASIDAALKLMDTAAIEYDDDNNPLGVEAARDGLLKTYPFLAAQTLSTGDKANPERNGRGSLTMDDVRKLSPDEVNARWPEVSALMGKK